jgi:NADH-ubiquinone oxidoreductase complex I, 21 kDa subunit
MSVERAPRTNAPPYVPGAPSPPVATWGVVTRGFAPSEWGMIAGLGATGYLLGFYQTSLRRRATGLAGAAIGVFGGFTLAYQASSARVLGLPRGFGTGAENGWASSRK